MRFFGETNTGWSNQVELTLALTAKMYLSEAVGSETWTQHGALTFSLMLNMTTSTFHVTIFKTRQVQKPHLQIFKWLFTQDIENNRKNKIKLFCFSNDNLWFFLLKKKY